MDAGKSKRSGLLAGLAITVFGLFIVWGTLAGRVPGSRIQSLALGAAFAIGGGLWLRSGGMTRGPRAEQAASESTVLDVIEGPFRRERSDLNTFADHSYASRGNARYAYYLYVGERTLRVSQAQYDASPDDGVVRAYVLPNSDHLVNLERVADAPPTSAETRAAAVLRERFGVVPEGERPAPRGAATPAALHEALLGRWEAQGMPMSFEFRADGTVVQGGRGADEERRWEVLDDGHIRIADQEQPVEVDGDVLMLATRGPTFRFHRVRS